MDEQIEVPVDEATSEEGRDRDNRRRLLLKRLAQGAYVTPVALALMTTRAHAC